LSGAHFAGEATGAFPHELRPRTRIAEAVAVNPKAVEKKPTGRCSQANPRMAIPLSILKKTGEDSQTETILARKRPAIKERNSLTRNAKGITNSR
jgi:hypothetical protein